MMKTALAVKVDDKKRIVLSAFAQPGEIYQIETPKPGQILLRLMTPAGHRSKMSYHQALKAIRSNGLMFKYSYDQLRSFTREP